MNYTKFMEALKGKQKKLDKNHNGELDKKDFEMLRKEEVEELDEGVDPSEVSGNPKMYDAATVKKAYYHKSATPEDKKTLERHLDRHHGMNNWRKPVKEETISEATVKTQKYSWGTMKTVHHGSDFSIPLHPEHHQAIAKLKDEQEHKFKDETGRHWTARRKGEDVHFQGANGGSSTKVPHSTMSEEVQFDEHAPVAPTLDKKYIKGTPENKAHKEKSKPINGHPTNKMKEEVEHIDELDTKTLKSYVNKNLKSNDTSDKRDTGLYRATNKIAKTQATSTLDKKVKTLGNTSASAHKNRYEYEASRSELKDRGIHNFAGRRTRTEEVELEEKLNPSMGAGEYVKDFQKSDAPQFAGKSEKKKRNMAIAAYLQAKRAVKEEVEELEEKSEQARKNKIMKNVMDASKGAKYNRDSGLKLTPGDTGHSTTQQMNKALGRNLRREAVSPITLKVNHALEAPHEEEWEDTGICPEHNKKDCHECGKGSMKENTGKTYKEFMMMLEYESDKSGSYKHTGTYGSEYAKKEREKDEKGFDSENEPAKRGPKTGSKRGPKANLGSSKLHTK